MNDKTTALAIILICFALTHLTAFWFNSFALPLIPCILQVRSCFWLVSLFAFKWDIKSNPWFVALFGLGVGLTVVGVLMLLLPLIGFTLFNAFYIVGTTCILASILLLMEQLNTVGKVKGQVQTFMNDASRWDTWIKVYNNDIGIAVEGVCVLLFPTLGALFIVVSVVELFVQEEEEQETHGGPEGRRGQEHRSNSVQTAIGGLIGGVIGGLLGGALGGLLGFMGGLSSLGSTMGSIGNVARSGPRSSQNRREKTQGDKQNMEKSKKLENLVRRKFMKVLRLLILGIVLWNWGLALLLWILRNLLAILVKLLQNCPTYVVYFIICFTFGAGCTFLGIYMLFLPELGFYLFKILYTVGNICLLGSTLFLKGPAQQLELMFDDTRKVATSLMLTCLVLTLLAAFWLQSPLLALMFSNLHILSSIWYCLSYIPCASDALKKITSYFI